MAGEGAAVGAAVGTAIMPGIGTAIGGLVGGMLDEPSKAQGGGSAPGMATNATSASVAVYGSGLDGNNWNVNFGGSQRNDSRADHRLEATGPTSSAEALGPGAIRPLSSAEGDPANGIARGLSANYMGVPAWAWAGAIGLIVWKKLQSKK